MQRRRRVQRRVVEMPMRGRAHRRWLTEERAAAAAAEAESPVEAAAVEAAAVTLEDRAPRASLHARASLPCATFVPITTAPYESPSLPT